MKNLLITWLITLFFTPLFAQTSFYVGTYTGTTSEGIYTMHIDTKEGKLILGEVAAKAEQPSYVAFSKDHKYVVAVNETSDETLPNKDGMVSLFSVDAKSGDLKFINKVPSGGAHPCHVSLDEDNNVFVANYSGGNVGVFQIKEGKLTKADQIIQYEGKGPNTARQEAAHAHFSKFFAKQKQVATVDLGSDKVHLYNIEEGKLKEATSISLTAGSGPRHTIWSTNGKYLYVLNELSCKIALYGMSDSGLELVEEVSTLPKDFIEENTCAAIKVSSDGKYLYASNRGHNSIAVFKIDGKSGKLKNLEYAKVYGNSPRDFSLSPKEDYVVVANQQSNNVVLFQRDKKTGLLEYRHEVALPMPVNVVFW